MQKTVNLPRRHMEMLELFQQLGPEHHLSAAEVYERLRANGHDVGLATIHRGLARLAGNGALMRLSLPNADAAVYELADTPHSHFICEACSSIKDVPFTLSANDHAQLEQVVGVPVTGVSVSFTGRCLTCSDPSLALEATASLVPDQRATHSTN